MQTRLLFFFVASMLIGGMMLTTSCSDSTDSLDEEVIGNFVDGTMEDIDRRHRTGRFGCFEFVFPITISFADSTSAEIDDYDDLRETVRSWKEANADIMERPMIDYPIEITTQDGEVTSINNRDEMRNVVRECRREMGPRHRGHDICFRFEYPINIEFPDGTVVSAASNRALKTMLRIWRSDHPADAPRPKIVYPVSIKFKDGTTAEVASKQALRAIKDACREG